MKNLITSLKNLLSKLSGENIEGSNLVEVIDNGARNIAESQGQSGSSGVLMITFTLESNGEEILADHNLQDVVDAIDAGIPIMGRMCYYNNDENGTPYELESTFSVFFIDYIKEVYYDRQKVKPFAAFALPRFDSIAYDNELLMYTTNLNEMCTIFLTEEGPKTEPIPVEEGPSPSGEGPSPSGEGPSPSGEGGNNDAGK